MRVLPLAFALFAALQGAAFAQGAPEPQPGHARTADGRHTLNLKDADIQALIATVSEITGKNFIVGPTVQGKVTVVSAQPMRPDEIYDVFLSVLRVHGLAAVPSGSMIKIVPESAAQADGGAGVSAARAESSDEVVTQIVPVKHVSAAELVAILRPLMPQGSQLLAHSTSNSLVVSDRAGNVKRLIDIVQRIDTVSDAQVEVVPLRHANAAELARTLTSLADDKTAQANGEASRVFADTRTNSILLAGSKNGRLKLRALIAHLDTPVIDGGDTQVVYLRYASAKDLVPILQGVAATLSGSAPPTAAKATDTASGAASVATIQAHEETNALIISAPPAIFRSLSAVVRQLDIRRSQVLIEAVIAEVADQTASELGVQWQVAGNKHIVGGTNFTGATPGNNILSASINPFGIGNGFNLGYVAGTIPGPDGKPIAQLGALISALRGDGKSNILSTPSVLTLDNQEAQIKVAQEVPFLTGQYTTNASSTVGGTTPTNGITNPFQTIERKDVGLVLKVKPQINEGESVRLDIHQEVSNLLPPVQGAVDLVTNKRELTTSVLVKDDALLVLGGLIDNQLKDNAQKVPVLGDVPLLGNLFRYRTNDHQKRDLMVFLHPKILRDEATEASVSSEKYNYMRTEQLQMRQQDWPITPRSQRPLLPDVHDFLASPSLDGQPNLAQPPARTPTGASPRR
ncbi:type II secretion system secretin GspD [Dokdonella sp.]|uniref:type II secretion system secretin GspD n=1 Tax=Dokdonella sp. TaxID=2291710 RepID=UPI001B02762F|nr:type II secretion system secretin GspD [Dokdonella sp.]MBO9662065.1 type II secretion system secretin GspD [Dokdonella sp.]